MIDNNWEAGVEQIQYGKVALSYTNKSLCPAKYRFINSSPLDQIAPILEDNMLNAISLEFVPLTNAPALV